MFRFTRRQGSYYLVFLFLSSPFHIAFSGDLSLGISPESPSNSWQLTLREAIPANAYTLASRPNLSSGSWQDTAVIQAGTGQTFVARVTGLPLESARYFKIRESSREDFDEDGLDNRSEYNAGSDPMRRDTDGDLFTDYEEVALTHSSPSQAGDGVEMIEDTRRMILAKWALIYPTPPVFTNQPGSPADLADLENLLRQLSGVFFTSKE